MRNLATRFPYSITSLCFGMVAILAVAYMGLIATVMTYAALTVEFSQSVRNSETTVAVLEKQYLSATAHITKTDYAAAGYVAPRTKIFVPTKSTTALR